MLAALLATAMASAASATFPGANGRVMYEVNPENGYHPILHTILPDGSDGQAIAQWVTSASWSPNGRRIVFSTDHPPGVYSLYSMRADGSGVRQLAVDGLNPSYSPSGGRIVFVSYAGITIMRSDGSDKHVIGQGVLTTWSPDGRWITYIKGSKGLRRPTLWEMHPNGTRKHQLVILGNNGGDGPIYSPDSKKFLFVRWHGDGSHTTFLADEDGRNVRRPPCADYFNLNGRYPASYSPDGRLISQFAPLYFGSKLAHLYRLRISDCRSRLVTRRAWFGGATDWQPLPERTTD